MFGGGKVGESSVIHQLKPSILVVAINNLLVNLFILKTFFAKSFIHLLLLNIINAKLSRYTVFPQNDHFGPIMSS